MNFGDKMKDGFIKVAAATPKVTVADVDANLSEIKRLIKKADGEKVNLLVFPELSLTAYTCGDLFFNDALLSNTQKALEELREFTKNIYTIAVVGLPFKHGTKLYNCAAVIGNGEILGIVPKKYSPCHNEFDEGRYFSAFNGSAFSGMDEIPFGEKLNSPTVQCPNILSALKSARICLPPYRNPKHLRFAAVILFLTLPPATR